MLQAEFSVFSAIISEFSHCFCCLFPKLTALLLTRVAIVRGEKPSSCEQICFSPGFLLPGLGWEDLKEWTSPLGGGVGNRVPSRRQAVLTLNWPVQPVLPGAVIHGCPSCGHCLLTLGRAHGSQLGRRCEAACCLPGCNRAGEDSRGAETNPEVILKETVSFRRKQWWFPPCGLTKWAVYVHKGHMVQELWKE